MILLNKLERLSLASLSSLVYGLWARPRAYPRVEHLKDSSIGYALALPTNNRLGWKGLPGTNALAYYKNSLLTAVKCFITLALGCKGLWGQKAPEVQ